MGTIRIATLAIGLAALSGCGDTWGEQAAVGAAGGGTVAAAVNRDVITGAAIGAAANIAYCRRYPSRC